MPVPLVAIVGRPNVGKSSLFNWLAGRRITIVDPTAGVTRDRVSTLIEAGGRYLRARSTPAAWASRMSTTSPTTSNGRSTLAIDQARRGALRRRRAGRARCRSTRRSAGRLRGVTKPVLLVANKCDAPSMLPQTREFYKLGRGELARRQRRAETRQGGIVRSDRRETARRISASVRTRDVSLKLAIVGRRNAGKSTFINSLAEVRAHDRQRGRRARRATAWTCASSATARRSSPSTPPACRKKKSLS